MSEWEGMYCLRCTCSACAPSLSPETDMPPPSELPPEPIHSPHRTLRHIRKKRKRTRKLSENRELMASVIVMVACGLLLFVCVIYLLSTRSCQMPRFLQSY
jgi:hypothetical protein